MRFEWGRSKQFAQRNRVLHVREPLPSATRHSCWLRGRREVWLEISNTKNLTFDVGLMLNVSQYLFGTNLFVRRRHICLVAFTEEIWVSINTQKRYFYKISQTRSASLIVYILKIVCGIRQYTTVFLLFPRSNTSYSWFDEIHFYYTVLRLYTVELGWCSSFLLDYRNVSWVVIPCPSLASINLMRAKIGLSLPCAGGKCTQQVHYR